MGESLPPRVDLAGVQKEDLDPAPGINRGFDAVVVKNMSEDRVESQAGIVADKMPAIAEAGVLLTKIVLGMVMVSITILFIYLFIADRQNGSELASAYDSVIRQAATGLDFPDPAATARLARLLDMASGQPDMKITADQEREGLALITAFGKLPTVSDLQRQDLKACLPLPTAEDRRSLLLRCLDTVSALQQGALGAALNLDKLRALTEFSKVVNDHRQTFRAFWLQIAQLVLLNLLLPLLTALLGYIFGTTRTSK